MNEMSVRLANEGSVGVHLAKEEFCHTRNLSSFLKAKLPLSNSTESKYKTERVRKTVKRTKRAGWGWERSHGTQALLDTFQSLLSAAVD